ncbi:MAG: stage II sporulation protein M [Candidatus Nanoarchaeia archaeon]|nr:stage II sporulation protein M [Candidatus Nanoarchaeia archaeon]
MVLESIMSPEKAEKKPWDMIFIGFLYASVAMFLSVWVFKEEASLVMVLLTVIASIPLIFNTIQLEEKKDLEIEREWTLLKEHSKALSFFVCLFFGFVLAYTVWFVFLPDTIVQATFETQLSTIKAINTQITGGSSFVNSANVFGGSIDAAATSSGSLLYRIVANNLKVLLFCVFFSFFYGAGAIFILTWNASVISAAVGTFIRNNIGSYATAIGLTKVGGYFHIFSLGLLRYSLHGIPEILAYFIGGLAGGIISIAVIKHDFGTKDFKRILTDSIDLMVLAVAVIFIAGVLEVYVTPLFF